MTWIITKIKQQKSLLSPVTEELKIKSKHLFRFFTPTEMENSREEFVTMCLVPCLLKKEENLKWGCQKDAKYEAHKLTFEVWQRTSQSKVDICRS